MSLPATSGLDAAQLPAVTRARHAHALRDAVACLDAAIAASAAGEELAAEELRGALQALNRLTGDASDVERVLDVIFAEFCVGK